MQITNNNTTVELNEEKILNLIIDQRIVALERIFENKYQVPFAEVPTIAFHAHLYLCAVELGLKAVEIADIYEINIPALTRIITSCHTKQQVNKQYQMYLYKLHLKCLKTKIAA